jgi:hypothetical protein
MTVHTHRDVARYVSRAHWWREQIASARTPAEQLMHAHNWILALVHQAEQSSRRRDIPADSDVLTGPAEDALDQAARAVIDICIELERQIAPGTRGLW